MNAKELQKQYGKCHPEHKVTHWVDAVDEGKTILGYWDWVVEQLKPKPKTDAEYVASPGHCPACNATPIESVGPIEADGADATQSCMCNTCGQFWQDDYKLVGWSAQE